MFKDRDSNDWLRKVNSILEIRPDLAIRFWVNGEEMCDPCEFSYSQQKVSSVEVVPWFINIDGEGEIGTNEANIRETLYEQCRNEEEDTDKLEKMVNDRWETEVDEVILITLDA